MKVQIGREKKDFLTNKMFGMFFEDINYAGDGGLYAEMIENRQFAFRKAVCGEKARTYDTSYAGDYGWEQYPAGEDARMQLIEGDALNAQNPHYMRFTVNGVRAGFANKAYDGITLQKGESYGITLWLRSASYQGTIEVCVLDKDSGETLSAVELIVPAGEDWTKAEAAFTAESACRGGRFVIFQNKGTVEYGYVSMIPKSAVGGVFRKDLFDVLAAAAPGFFRFPGGCIVEGANLNNRYQWKQTVGLPWERTWNWNRWCVHPVEKDGGTQFFSFYNQSYGIGFYEYFLLCDLLHAKPLPVLSVGIACQFQSDELVPIDSPEFDAYVQDAIDLIQFANGDVTTKWGAVRAQMGHPAPFGLEYLCIGNEQWETESVDFFDRYRVFEKRVHEADPSIRLIGSAGPNVGTDTYSAAWEFYRGEYPGNRDFTAAVDEHYYMPPAWFIEKIHMYDDYPREIPVFAGEYAAHCEKKENNLEAALSEAAFMCGLEKNADVILFASAAPLFAREGYVQWAPDLIWFDDEKVMGTPGYYVQKLFGLYTGNQTCSFRAEGADENLYLAVSEDEKAVYVKFVNLKEEATVLEELTSQGETLNLNEAEVYCMKGSSLSEQNTLQDPERIVLRPIPAGETICFPGLSCGAVVLRK